MSPHFVARQPTSAQAQGRKRPGSSMEIFLLHSRRHFMNNYLASKSSQRTIDIPYHPTPFVSLQYLPLYELPSPPSVDRHTQQFREHLPSHLLVSLPLSLSLFECESPFELETDHKQPSPFPRLLLTSPSPAFFGVLSTIHYSIAHDSFPCLSLAHVQLCIVFGCSCT